MTCLAGIGEKDAELTILDTPCCPAVLALHAHRLGPFFQKPRFIDDQHGSALPKHLFHIPAQHIAQLLAVPHGSIQEVLHRIRRRFSRLFCQLPAIFAFHRTEQPSHIRLRSLPGLHLHKTGAHPLAYLLERVSPDLCRRCGCGDLNGGEAIRRFPSSLLFSSPFHSTLRYNCSNSLNISNFCGSNIEVF